MDMDACVRLLIGMSILRLRDYNDILMQAEKLINKNMANLGNNNIFQILIKLTT